MESYKMTFTTEEQFENHELLLSYMKGTSHYHRREQRQVLSDFCRLYKCEIMMVQIVLERRINICAELYNKAKGLIPCSILKTN